MILDKLNIAKNAKEIYKKEDHPYIYKTRGEYYSKAKNHY